MKIINRTTERRIGLLWHVRRCLSWIDPADLYGIDRVVLQEEIGPPAKDSPEWHQQAHKGEATVYAQYFAKNSKSPPTIAMYVRSLYYGIPRIYWLSPVITLHVARTLAHEVGHHIVAQRGYIFDKREKVEGDFEEELANRYSFSVTRRMQTRWYYRCAGVLTRDLADWHYVFGLAEWKDGRFDRATVHWKKAYFLNSNHAEAGYWYARGIRGQLPDNKVVS